MKAVDRAVLLWNPAIFSSRGVELSIDVIDPSRSGTTYNWDHLAAEPELSIQLKKKKRTLEYNLGLAELEELHALTDWLLEFRYAAADVISARNESRWANTVEDLEAHSQFAKSPRVRAAAEELLKALVASLKD